jgi:hypothetical protein
MFFESTRWPGETHVARALITDPLDKEPSAHVFYEAHVSWLQVNDELPKKVSQASQVAASGSPAPPSGAATDVSDA